MNILKHTPGPWTAFHYTKYKEWHVSTPIEGSGMRLGLFPDGVPTEENAEADARLIAASPDLLAVVQELEESAAYWSEYDVPLGIVDRMRAAIAKATGAAQ